MSDSTRVYIVKFVDGKYEDNGREVWETSPHSGLRQRVAPGCAVAVEMDLLSDGCAVDIYTREEEYITEDTSDNTYRDAVAAMRAAHYRAVEGVRALEKKLEAAKLRRAATCGWFSDMEDGEHDGGAADVPCAAARDAIADAERVVVFHDDVMWNPVIPGFRAYITSSCGRYGISVMSWGKFDPLPLQGSFQYKESAIDELRELAVLLGLRVQGGIK